VMVSSTNLPLVILDFFARVEDEFRLLKL